jgi:putative transposase
MERRLQYHRFLPHIQLPGATLFVTFRLAGSIPRSLIRQLVDEGEQSIRKLEAVRDQAEQSRLAYIEQRRSFGRYDQVLDSCAHGPAWLKEPGVASLVAAALHSWDVQRYTLDCYCIMSNHAHVVLTPLARENGEYHGLSKIMQSLKGCTARRSNQILGRSGRFWQPESYDHIVRDEAELERIRKYVVNNPVKAGLADSWHEWPWTFLRNVGG